MRVEYFAGEMVVLIYGNHPNEAELLRNRVAEFTVGHQQRLAVHELPGFEGVAGCELFFSAGTWDSGVLLLQPPNVLECKLKAGSWDNVAGLLEPFCLPSAAAGFQYLDYAFNSRIRLIISRERCW